MTSPNSTNSPNKSIWNLTVPNLVQEIDAQAKILKNTPFREKSIYVAGKFEEAQKVKEVINEFLNLGFNITYDWTQDSIASIPTPKEKVQYLEQAAIRCDKGVRKADYVLILNNPLLFGGATELGIALSCYKEVIIQNPEIRENVFFYLPNVHFTQNKEASIQLIKELAILPFLSQSLQQKVQAAHLLSKIKKNAILEDYHTK
jgi:hypothetical protein